MTHLKIELNNGIIEEVSSAVIDKLYDIVHSGNLDNTSNLIGRLHTSATYQDYIDYLEDAFKIDGVKLLIIDATKKYIMFADSAIASYWANSTYGDGTGIDSTSASGILNIPNNAFKSNTSILTFNELGRYFPNCTAINYYAFLGTSNLTSIDLSNITTVGLRAFDSSGLSGVLNLPKVNVLEEGCLALTNDVTEINIGTDLSDSNRITVINTNVFNHSGQNNNLLQRVTGLNKVLEIKTNGFYNCRQLLSIDTTSELTTIRSEAFSSCTSLECIDISNVTLIENSALDTCSSLVDLATNDPTLINTGAATYTFTWSTVPDRIFAGCLLTNKSFSFPNATSIGTSAFNSTKIVSIDIPSVTTISAQGFRECTSLTSVDLSNCTSIGEMVFKGCTSLTTIDISNVTSLGDKAFLGCSSLTSLDFSNVTSISFSGGMLENYTFLNCSALQYAYFPILQGSPLYGLFRGCTSLKLYIAPNITNVFRLNYPFLGCTNLKGIFLPKANVGSLSLDVYHYNALFGGLSVKVVDVGNVTSLNEYTMKGSSSLTAFIIRNTTTIPTLTGETNASYFSNVTFYVDDNLLSIYQADSAWSNANIHLDVISNFVLSNHLDSDTLALYNSIINPS